MENILRKNKIYFVGLIALAIIICFALTVQPSYAKMKYHLPTSVKVYNYDSGKAKLCGKASFKYNKKKNLVKASGKCKQPWKGGQWDKYVFKGTYKYKGKKISYIKGTFNGSSHYLKESFKKGKISKLTYVPGFPEGDSYKIKRKNGRVSKISFVYWDDKATHKYSYKKYSAKKIKSITRSAKNQFSNTHKRTVKLNKTGLVTKVGSYKVTYKKNKKGRVLSIKIKKKSKTVAKVVYGYKKSPTTTSKKKRNAIINDAALSQGDDLLGDIGIILAEGIAPQGFTPSATNMGTMLGWN